MLRNEQFVNEVLRLTNEFRAQNGLNALKLNEELTVTGEFHSLDMAKNNYFEHTGLDGSLPWDRAKRVGFDSKLMAENIAAGQYSPESVVQAWIDSPGHRKNLLNATVTEMGLGYYKPAADGITARYDHYWTQLFATSDRQAATYLTSPFTVASTPVPTPTPASIPTPVPVSTTTTATTITTTTATATTVTTTSNSTPKLSITPSELNELISERPKGLLSELEPVSSRILRNATENTLSNEPSDEDDMLMGTRGNDMLMGYAGDDTLMGLGKRDRLMGGSGSDLLNGGAGRDRLAGDEGNDELIGGGGRDRLVGGAGDDMLTGGGARDLFVFESSRLFAAADFGIDQITDFKKGDKIILDRTSFGEITVQQIVMVADDAAAAISGGQIAYSQATGSLFFNANGSESGFGTGGQFARVDSDNNPLTAAPGLTIADFQIVA
jgi:serralysin